MGETVTGKALHAGRRFRQERALYGVSVVDPLAWSAAIALLLTVSTLANLVPARRASIVDPSRALRAG
jgi:ABC-type antimicrobial peptide transport system permease subunit